jgi:thiamine pyrophosphate-dependent acetolactate synthase large subunit-like protein
MSSNPKCQKSHIIGARLAKPDWPIVGLCGDGSFALSAGDLATMTRIGRPYSRRNRPAVKRALSHGAPYFIEVVAPGEHEVIPPMAEWQRVATEAAKPIVHGATHETRVKMA